MLGPELDEVFEQTAGVRCHVHVVVPVPHRAPVDIAPTGGDARGEVVGHLIETIADLGVVLDPCLDGRFPQVVQPELDVAGIDGDVVVMRGHLELAGSARLTGGAGGASAWLEVA
ncbi:unannotated protein [freshwater metagenome]|uniref:Unannotated protein n=1 Tax=freshwater metagenome TaxID=449393 RepID=A0A6J6A7N7_9ZZZZ